MGSLGLRLEKAWPGMRAFTPYRLGTESDWADIISATGPYNGIGVTWLYAWKTNGQAWAFTGPFNSTRSAKMAKNKLEAGTDLPAGRYWTRPNGAA